eukprot:TRINITY_DN6884_c0_g1_i10.p3 TRINITY_DN6884_c0_g1~~TRINITY_DN6884_c0_g1_i10.p3  ORF type:complete len:245 (+),score=49.56 TRINITY_DN6884_c0_g1_i10:2527-3261(+)
MELARVIGNCISAIVRCKESNGWPDILSLIAFLIKTGKRGAENGIICLEELCEDMDTVCQITDFEPLIPLLVSAARSKELSGKVRGASLYSLTFGYIITAGAIFDKYVQAVIQVMFELMQETLTENADEHIEKHLCGLCIILIKDKREGVSGISKELFGYNVRVLGSRNYEAACAACDFWQIYLKTEWSREHEEKRLNVLEETLTELIPQLLLAMRYSDTDLSGMIRDSESDVKCEEEQNGTCV